MEQRKPLLIAEYIYCINGKNSSLICTSENCKNTAFMCMDKECQCTQAKHNKCTLIQQTKLFVDNIEKQRIEMPQENKSAIDAVFKMYEQMIQYISKQRLQFVNFIDMFGLKDNMRKLVSLINDERQKEVVGDLAHKVHVQIQNKSEKPSDFQLDEKKVEKVWKEKMKQLDGILFKMAEFRDYHNRKIDSKIIDIDQLGMIRNFIHKTVKHYELLYRASDNKFSARRFHQKCDGIEDTLTIVKTQFGKVIGGYTPLEWDSPKQDRFVEDYAGESFLFSLTLNKKYELTERQHAIKQSKSYGPIFGGGWDLYLTNKCNDNNNSSVNFPHSYKSQEQPMKSQESYTSFSGQTNGNHFIVKQYEVFKVIWR